MLEANISDMPLSTTRKPATTETGTKQPSVASIEQVNRRLPSPRWGRPSQREGDRPLITLPLDDRHQIKNTNHAKNKKQPLQ